MARLGQPWEGCGQAVFVVCLLVTLLWACVYPAGMLPGPSQEPSAHQSLMVPGMGLGASQECFLWASCAPLQVCRQAFIT